MLAQERSSRFSGRGRTQMTQARYDAEMRRVCRWADREFQIGLGGGDAQEGGLCAVALPVRDRRPD
jgi:hypothetical protein